MADPSVTPGETFRRNELVWQLRRLADLYENFRAPLHVGAIPPVIEFNLFSLAAVEAVGQLVGRIPQQFKDECFVDYESAELRIRWSMTVRDETGLTYSRPADDPTPVSPARVPLHTGAVTNEGLVDESEPRGKVFACTAHGIHPHPGDGDELMTCLDCPQCRPAGSSVD